MNERPLFIMIISDVFDIYNKGIVVTGQIVDGRIEVGNTVELMNNFGLFTGNANVIGIEKTKKQIQYAEKNEIIALVLDDIDKKVCENSKVIILRSEKSVNETFLDILNV